MANNFISLPSVGPVDPTKVGNDNFQFLQGGASTDTNLFEEVYREILSINGVYLYEAMIVGVQDVTNFASFRRTFSVLKTSDGVSVLDISSDYTKKTDDSWAISIGTENSDVVVKAKGNNSHIKWIASFTKTMFKQ